MLGKDESSTGSSSCIASGLVRGLVLIPQVSESKLVLLSVAVEITGAKYLYICITFLNYLKSKEVKNG